MRKKTVAQLLVDTLAHAGVKRVYGIAGDSLVATPGDDRGRHKNGAERQDGTERSHDRGAG